MKQITNSDEQTRLLAQDFSQNYLKKGGLIYLSGELGAGKTTFVQGFAKGLGITESIISPTFVLIRQHKIPESDRFLFHIDLYRLDENIDPKSLGIEEMLKSANIVLIEWPEKIKNFTFLETVSIKIKIKNDNTRQIQFVY